MTLLRPIMSEVTKALAVLALVFLSFAHQPTSAVAGDGPRLAGEVSVATLSYCGDLPDESGGHAPCHACRAVVADLPAAPCVGLAAELPVAPVSYAPAESVPSLAVLHSASPPRGPPTLA